MTYGWVGAVLDCARVRCMIERPTTAGTALVMPKGLIEH